jgi:peptide/nickel transport system substrate-binding protein
MLIRAEPNVLAAKSLVAAGISIQNATRAFNATLDIEDSREDPRPYLAEALPRLDSDSWRVLPDGRMQTTYRLKPNLAWHDGRPLSAEDFAFAWRVYTAPDLGVATATPQSAIESVDAPDERTVMIRWRQPYPFAESLADGFQALPRHILEQQFQQGQPEAFINHPFWTLEYVGLGPFRLDRWEPGSHLEGVAFDGHVWGRPKIDRLIVRFVADENTAFANLLSESVHLVADRSIRYEQASPLQAEWRASGKGTVVLTPTQGRYTHVQVRPDYANPRSLLDVRVRRALAYGIDKQALNDGLFEGMGLMTSNFIRHNVPYHADIDRAVTKYPYDPRASGQLLADFGYTRGADGTFANAAGEHFRVQLMNQAGTQPERETTIMVDTWRRLGIDASGFIVPVSRSRDAEERATFSGVQNATGQGVWEDRMRFLGSADIGTPQNRWQGQNRGGWSSPEYDQLWEAFTVTLDRSTRNRQIVQMEALVSEQLPVIPLFFNFAASAYLSALVGPDPNTFNDTLLSWNIHEWQLR